MLPVPVPAPEPELVVLSPLTLSTSSPSACFLRRLITRCFFLRPWDLLCLAEFRPRPDAADALLASVGLVECWRSIESEKKYVVLVLPV